MGRPAGISDREWKRCEGFTERILLRDRVWYRHAWTGMPPWRDLGNEISNLEVQVQLHDESGYWGKNSTYEKAQVHY